MYAEPANSGIVDGVAELVFQVDERCAIALVEVRPSSNCRIVRQAVRDDGRTLEVDLGYEVPSRTTTSLTYDLWYRDREGEMRRAYGGEPEGGGAAVAASAAGGPSSPNPPPVVVFP